MSNLGLYNNSSLIQDDVLGSVESLTSRIISTYKDERKPFTHRSMDDIRARERRDEMVQSFIGVLNTRAGLIRTYESLRNLDVVQTILDVVQDDGFSSSQDDNVFTVTYEPEEEDELSEKINDEVQSFIQRVGLRDFVKGNMEDLLLYGEYPFRMTCVDGRGITEIIDDVSPDSIIAFYKGGLPQFYVEKIADKMVIRSTDEMGHFCLDSRKIRVKVTDMRNRIPRMVPEYVRVGRSIVYQAISKLKRLQVFEMAAIADSLKKVMTPLLVGVSVPASATPQDVADVVKKYEIELSSPTTPNATDPGNYTFYDIFELVGRVKVIPNYSDGKGNVGTIEMSTGHQADIDAKEDRLRLSAAKAVGIPSYYISLTEEGGSSKLETLKVFSRYSRKLVMVQSSIGDGIRSIISTHLRMRGMAVREENIKVRFKSLVNMDLLDSVEYTAASVDIMTDLFGALENIASSDAARMKLNPERLLELLNKFLSPMAGADGVLELDTDPELGDPGADDFGFDSDFGGGGRSDYFNDTGGVDDIGGDFGGGGGGPESGEFGATSPSGPSGGGAGMSGSPSPEEGAGGPGLQAGATPLPAGGERIAGQSDRLLV